MQKYAKLNIFGILALIALRVGIGWHFYMEGVTKVRGGFSSEGFVQAAKGPLAPKFQTLVWDNDGRLRLDQAKLNAVFDKASRDAADHFMLTDVQKTKLEKVNAQFFGLQKDRWVGKLNEVYSKNEEEIYKYWQTFDRVEDMEESGTWTGVESLRGQKEKIKAERMNDVRPALADIDAIWQQYEDVLNSEVASPEQVSVMGKFSFGRPGEGLLSSRSVNQIIPIFDMIVGILLMIGLLTPLAGWAAALFLLSVVLSQMPGTPGAEPTYFQAIEALACVAVATMDAGRYAGLDFLSWSWWQNQDESAAQPA